MDKARAAASSIAVTPIPNNDNPAKDSQPPNLSSTTITNSTTSSTTMEDRVHIDIPLQALVTSSHPSTESVSDSTDTVQSTKASTRGHSLSTSSTVVNDGMRMLVKGLSLSPEPSGANINSDGIVCSNGNGDDLFESIELDQVAIRDEELDAPGTVVHEPPVENRSFLDKTNGVTWYEAVSPMWITSLDDDEDLLNSIDAYREHFH